MPVKLLFTSRFQFYNITFNVRNLALIYCKTEYKVYQTLGGNINGNYLDNFSCVHVN